MSYIHICVLQGELICGTVFINPIMKCFAEEFADMNRKELIREVTALERVRISTLYNCSYL